MLWEHRVLLQIFMKTQVYELKHSFLSWTLHFRGQKSGYFSDKAGNDGDRSDEDTKQTFAMWHKEDVCDVTQSGRLWCDAQSDGRFSPVTLKPPSRMQTPCIPRRTSQDGSTSLTRRGNHPLPLLEKRCFETVARAQRIRFMARHQLLHWLQNYAQL